MAYDDIPPDVMAARVVRSRTKTPSEAVKAMAILKDYNTDSSIDHIANIARDFYKSREVTIAAFKTLAEIKGDVASTSIWKIARDVDCAKLAGLKLLAERDDNKAAECIKEIGCSSGEKIAHAALSLLDQRIGPVASDYIGDIGSKSHKMADAAFDILEHRTDRVATRKIIDLGVNVEGMERHAFQACIRKGDIVAAGTVIHRVRAVNPIQALGIVLSNVFLSASDADKTYNLAYQNAQTVEAIFSYPEQLLTVTRNNKGGLLQLSTILSRAVEEGVENRSMSVKDMKRRVSSCEVFERKYSAQYQAFVEAFH